MTCRTLEECYHIDRQTFEKQYKNELSGYRDWCDIDHADKWLVFPENIGPNLAIDESSLSNASYTPLLLIATDIALIDAWWP